MSKTNDYVIKRYGDNCPYCGADLEYEQGDREHGIPDTCYCPECDTVFQVNPNRGEFWGEETEKSKNSLTT